MQPKTSEKEESIDAMSWAGLLGDSKSRNLLIKGLSSEEQPANLTHSRYMPLQPLISKLAAILVVDTHWLPVSDVRSHPEYINEAFQRVILQFILDNCSEKFMTDLIGPQLRKVALLVQSQGLSSTRNEDMDRAEREEVQQCHTTGRTEVGCVC